jgi:hypothetical protein
MEPLLEEPALSADEGYKYSPGKSTRLMREAREPGAPADLVAWLEAGGDTDVWSFMIAVVEMEGLEDIRRSSSLTRLTCLPPSGWVLGESCGTNAEPDTLATAGGDFERVLLLRVGVAGSSECGEEVASGSVAGVVGPDVTPGLSAGAMSLK